MPRQPYKEIIRSETARARDWAEILQAEAAGLNEQAFILGHFANREIECAKLRLEAAEKRGQCIAYFDVADRLDEFLKKQEPEPANCAECGKPEYASKLDEGLCEGCFKEEDNE